MGENDKVDLNPSFLGFATAFEDALQEQRAEIATGFEARNKLLNSAHTALFACIASIHSRDDREFPLNKATEKTHRFAIHAATIQGIHLIKAAISTASYVQAASLIRQEIEAVEACRGLRQGKQKEGNTPRVKALRHLGADYGRLSEIAHHSKSKILLYFTDAIASGVDHKLNENLERRLMGLHIVALLGICLDAAELRPFSNEEMMSPDEHAWLTSVCGILADHGILTPSA